MVLNSLTTTCLRRKKEKEERGGDRDESEQGVGKAAVIMDEKTRRGRVGSTGSRERRSRGKMGGREGRTRRRASRARQDRAGHGERRAPRAPEPGTGSGSDKPGRRTEWRERNPSPSRWRRVSSGAVRRVGCGGDVAPVVFYLLKTSSELSAQVEFHSWNLNKGGQGFSPVASSHRRSSLSPSLSLYLS